jgi:hypothetical protein
LLCDDAGPSLDERAERSVFGDFTEFPDSGAPVLAMSGIPAMQIAAVAAVITAPILNFMALSFPHVIATLIGRSRQRVKKKVVRSDANDQTTQSAYHAQYSAFTYCNFCKKNLMTDMGALLSCKEFPLLPN